MTVYVSSVINGSIYSLSHFIHSINILTLKKIRKRIKNKFIRPILPSVTNYMVAAVTKVGNDSGTDKVHQSDQVGNKRGLTEG